MILLPALVQQLRDHLVVQQRQLPHAPRRAHVDHPPHPSLAQVPSDTRGALPELLPKFPDLLDSLPGVIRDATFDLLPDDVGQLWRASVGGYHDLEWSVAHLRPEVKVAGRGDISDIDRDLALPAKGAYLTGDLDFVYGREDHVNALEVLGAGERTIMIGDPVRTVDEVLGESVEAGAGRDEGYAGVGDEDGLNAARGYVTAANDEDVFVLELPCDDEGASGER